MLSMDNLDNFPKENRDFSNGHFSGSFLKSIVEFFKTAYEKLSKEQRTFFLIFSALVVFSGVFFHPSYDRLKSQVASLGDQQGTNQDGLEGLNAQTQRKYVSSIIELNTASIEELQTLPGIGPSKARAIVEYRKQHPFTKPEDLMNVPGIGQKTYEKLKERIKVENMDAQVQNNAVQNVTTIEKENKDTAIKQKDNEIQLTQMRLQNEKININTATLEELQKLPGIGPAKAQAIIDYRTLNGPFKNIEEIKNVKGIGEKTFEKLRDLITVH
ncbi:MAG: ComEA family DNA-binding protein [Fervidobacterium pennivorans]|nr:MULTISPECIES: ComEA family DNA-binding protein [Fervidobacterium]NPU89741.1 ComEA family DNA-binding protein [Fervidobacterium sp.]